MIKKCISKRVLAYISAFTALFVVAAFLFNTGVMAQSDQVKVNEGRLGFKIPDFSDILTFAIRGFFVIAGLAALFYLLLGAFSWVTSGGDKDAITAARDKITNSVIGLILIIAVLAVVVTLEQIVFNKRLCLGLSCPASIPGLLQVKCYTSSTGTLIYKDTATNALGAILPGDPAKGCCEPDMLQDITNDSIPDICS